MCPSLCWLASETPLNLWSYVHTQININRKEVGPLFKKDAKAAVEALENMPECDAMELKVSLEGKKREQNDPTWLCVCNSHEMHSTSPTHAHNV